MVQKKGSFSDFEILKIYQEINKEHQDPTTRAETHHTEKIETRYKSETQISKNRNTTHTQIRQNEH